MVLNIIIVLYNNCVACLKRKILTKYDFFSSMHISCLYLWLFIITFTRNISQFHISK
jgi:hypothetical protein